ncbi:MAG TPA: FtsX-like permease family protein [Terriglobales bacterium]|nr:FtsX-like permease family protein [Terriglobales bacterium]
MSLRRSMFFHLLRRGLLGRGNRPVIALIALTIAATIITAMLNLYYGLESKLNRDFRAYGANVTVAAPEGSILPPEAFEKAQQILPPGSLVVRFAFAIAHASDGSAIVIAGTDFSKLQNLDKWWLVSKWPTRTDEAIVGVKAEPHISPSNGSFDLNFSDRTLHLIEATTVRTGAEEENRIYISLPGFESWTGVQPSLLEVSVPGSRQQVNAAIRQLQSAFPSMQVRPVRQLLEAQGAVITRMRSVMLASTLLITLMVALCVFSTLTSSVLERRRDFAVMKAIGSSQTTVNGLFAGEAVVIALIAALSGYLLGSGLAAWISKANFYTAVTPRIAVLPLVIACSVALALLAALLPLAQLQGIEPAGILKGE